MTPLDKPTKEPLRANATMEQRDSLYGTLKTWIMQLPGVTTEPHRFGGTEFQVEGVEFMHSHGSSLLDIHLSKDDQAKALNEGTALPHRYAPQAGWVTFRIRDDRDIERAEYLVDMAYRNAKRALAQRHSNQTRL